MNDHFNFSSNTISFCCFLFSRRKSPKLHWTLRLSSLFRLLHHRERFYCVLFIVSHSRKRWKWIFTRREHSVKVSCALSELKISNGNEQVKSPIGFQPAAFGEGVATLKSSEFSLEFSSFCCEICEWSSFNRVGCSLIRFYRLGSCHSCQNSLTDRHTQAYATASKKISGANRMLGHKYLSNS